MGAWILLRIRYCNMSILQPVIVIRFLTLKPVFPVIYKLFNWLAVQNSWHRFLYDWKHLVQMDLIRWIVKLGKCLEKVKWVVSWRTVFLNTLCYKMNTKVWCYSKTTCSWYFVHSHFVCKNLNAVCADYWLNFRDLLTIFFATFLKSRLQIIT